MENESTNDPGVDRGQESSGPDAGSQAGSAESLTDDLFKELTVLGSRFVEVVQSAWNSEERKQIQDDLKEGISSVASSLESGFQKVVDNEQAKEVIDKADGVADTVGNKLRSSQAVSDLGESLIKGLSILTGKLETWTAEINAREAASNVDASGEDASDRRTIPGYSHRQGIDNRQQAKIEERAQDDVLGPLFYAQQF